MMAQPIIRILKRQPNSEPCLSDLPQDISKKNEVKNRPIKTLEEREAAYAEARKRILGSSHDNSSQDIFKEIDSNGDNKISMESFTTPSQHPTDTISITEPQIESHINDINIITNNNQPYSLKSQIAFCPSVPPFIKHSATFSANSTILDLTTNNAENNLLKKTKQLNIIDADNLNMLASSNKPINNIVLELNTPATDNTKRNKNNIVNNYSQKLANDSYKYDSKEIWPVDFTNYKHTAVSLLQTAETSISNQKLPEIYNFHKNNEQQKIISFQPNQFQFKKMSTDHDYDLICPQLNVSNIKVSNNMVDNFRSINPEAEGNMCVQLANIKPNSDELSIKNLIVNEVTAQSEVKCTKSN